MKPAEKAMSELQKYLTEKGKDFDDNDIDNVIQEFIQEYNHKQDLKNKGLLPLTDEEKAYDLFNEARNCDNPAKAKRTLRKALKLKPDFLEAKIELATYIDDSIKYIKELYRLEKEEKKRLEEAGYFSKDNISHFYGITETRPYMRLLEAIAVNYYKMGCLKKAVEIYEHMIKLNKSDNLGCRYNLMAIYTLLEDQEKMEQILHDYPEKSVPAYLFQTIFYYKLGDFNQAKKHLRSLHHLVPAFKKMMNDEIKEEDLISDAPEGYYTPYTLEEILIYINENPLLFANEYLLEWMLTELNKMK